MNKQVFISFSNEDRPLAEKICDGLERHGVSCWISSRDIPPGADYQSSAVIAINAAQLVVLVFSSSANVSQKVIKELSLASGMPVVAVRIEDVMPAGAFRQLIDGTVLHSLVGDFDGRLEGFCRHVRAKLQSGAVAHAPLPVPTPARPEGPRLAKPAIAVLVLAIVAFGVRAWRGAEPDFWAPATETSESRKVAQAASIPAAVTPVAAPVTTDVAREAVPDARPARADPPAVAKEVAKPRIDPKPRAPVKRQADPPAVPKEVAKAPSDPKPKAPVARRAPKPTVDAQVESDNRQRTGPVERVAAAWKPSFNCKYARTHAELMICATPELAAADVELDRAYRAARKAVRGQRWLSDDQDAWRASVRDTCPNVDCMLSVYEERIDELNEL